MKRLLPILTVQLQEHQDRVHAENPELTSEQIEADYLEHFTEELKA